MVKLIAAGLMCVINCIASISVVTSDITANATWDADTLYIDKALFAVQKDSRLTISPGTRIIFKKGRFITAYGTITAIGTPTDSIWFAQEKSTVTWQGIRMVGRQTGMGKYDSSFISYCSLVRTYCSDVDSFYMKRGAAIYCGAGNYVNLNNCLLSENEGYHGGAVYVDSGSNVLIDQCCFYNNKASIFGGGAIMTCDKYNARLLVGNCRFSFNSARTGGAVRIGSGVTVAFTNCIFYRDTTRSINPENNDLDGGAIAVFGPADVTLRGCIIYHCRSYGKGGGIYSSDASVKLINCTIVSNTSVLGGGIYFAHGTVPSSPQVVNTIIDGNGTLFNIKTPCDSAGCAVYIDSGVAPVFRYCALSDTIFDYSAKRYTGSMSDCFINRSDFVYRVKRNFSDTMVSGFQLDYEDPIVNGGTPDTTGLGLPEFDLLGQKRVFGDTVDIGAIEYNDSLIKVSVSRERRKPPQISINSPCKAMLYSLDGRRLAVLEVQHSQQSIRQFVEENYPRGVYLIALTLGGRQGWTEKVLVK